MRDYRDTSLEPYGLLDAIAAGFEEGLHPELRRLMRECKAAALQLQAKNIVAFPSPIRVAGQAPENQSADIQGHTAAVIDIRTPIRRAATSYKATPK